jgi:phosphatidylinositol alpha-1,6-mannosyltransferase
MFDVRRVGTSLHRYISLAGINAAAVREARAFRPDVILSAHIIVSPGARAASKATGAPIVQYFYANEVGARPRLARSALRNADSSIVISTFTQDLVRQLGVEDARLKLVTPGVDLGPSPSRNGQVPDPPTVITVARMEERYKGHDVLARALPLVRSQVDGARWVAVGDGRLRPTFEALVRANGCEDAAVFTGSLDDAERDAWVERSAVFAMPSRLPAARPGGEGFGIVFLEAGAHGLPVVGGNVGGAVDAVRAGVTGLLVDPTDHLAVADALVELLRDPARSAEMGRAGRKFAEAHAWPRISEHVEDVLLAAAGRVSPTAMTGRQGQRGPARSDAL